MHFPLQIYFRIKLFSRLLVLTVFLFIFITTFSFVQANDLNHNECVDIPNHIDKEENLSEELNAYIKSIKRKISKVGNLNYPEKVRKKRYKENKEVTVKISVVKNGNLSSLEILRPSCDPEINRNMTQVLDLVFPFDPFPKEIFKEEIHFTQKIIYVPLSDF